MAEMQINYVPDFITLDGWMHFQSSYSLLHKVCYVKRLLMLQKTFDDQCVVNLFIRKCHNLMICVKLYVFM